MMVSSEPLCARHSYHFGWGLPSRPGHFVMPHEYAMDAALASDFWTVESVGAPANV